MKLLPFILAMAGAVVLSNILVQVRLGDWLTWGAISYPLAFLANDITNRVHGAAAARRVVLVGFVTGIVCSLVGTQIMGANGPLVTFRVALASGVAFLVAQLLDVTIFDRMRRMAWWRAPAASTIAGTSLDTMIFFSVAFAGTFVFLNPAEDVAWANEAVPLLGAGPALPLWISLAVADWGVKLLWSVAALLPFRIIVGKLTTSVA